MGSCCNLCFSQEEEPPQSQNRMSLLDSPVRVAQHTENDRLFTYYLRKFEQEELLERVIKKSKTQEERNQSEQSTGANQEAIIRETEALDAFIRQTDDPDSAWSHKVKEDKSTIMAGLRKGGIEKDMERGCLIKLQIQATDVLKDITQLTIQPIIDSKSVQFRKSEPETIAIAHNNRQIIYRQIVFPCASNSKLKLSTSPLISSITIGLEDLMSQQALLDIFTLKKGQQQCGFAALRVQFVSVDPVYQIERLQRLRVLAKELRMCSQGSGFDNLSSFISESSENKNTFISDPVSEYPNQYKA